MRKLSSIIAVLLMGLTTAFAQDLKSEKAVESKPKTAVQKKKSTQHQKQNERVMEMDKVVSFSEDQKMEIQKIHDESHKQVLELRAKYKDVDDKSPMKEEMKKINMEKRRKVKAVMNDKQMEKWEAHKKANKRVEPVKK